MDAQDVLTRTENDQALATLPHWRYLGPLQAAFKCASPAAALELLAAIGELAQQANHHPDVDWRYDTVFVSCCSHDAQRKVTARDVQLVTAISAAATKAGATARPDVLRSYDLAIDTVNPAAISRVWKAGLGYSSATDGSLYDPHGRGPGVWFQQTSTPNPNSIHVDVNVPFSESLDAVAATVAAGGFLNDRHAPSWTILSDAQGNRLCICTEEQGGDA
ncbi:4a-hydroxytetrahydrobiopterin dehydratase [Specibacter sp. NPDC057265]|uniref:4a-hydroxytetrahydrobiopterin dehydratase n=1 Tax=Specibacter sp. NPDC057265 TaxID=3346075 RepID=UPI00362A2BEA